LSECYLGRCTDLRFRQVPPPASTAADEAELAHAWKLAVAEQPALFDGPAVSCITLEDDGAGRFAISWARVTYRHFLERRTSTGLSRAPSLFVCVAQLTYSGELIIGRMAKWTAAPGRWQLPGGNVEPPEAGETLDTANLRNQAARELQEELGVEHDAADLSPRLVVRRGNRSVGVVFEAPPVARAVLERSSPCDEHGSATGDVEFDRISYVGVPGSVVPANIAVDDCLPAIAAAVGRGYE